MNIEDLVFKYDKNIDDSYLINNKENIIYINPIYNNCISVCSSLCEYFGYKDIDELCHVYKKQINNILFKLDKD